MINNTQPQLPAEILREIDLKAEAATANFKSDTDYDRGKCYGLEQGYEAGAIEYATKLHRATELIKRMNDKYSALHHDSLRNDIKSFLDGTK